MRAAVTVLEAEMLRLLDVWRALRLDMTTDEGWRQTMERQVKTEVDDVRQALEYLRGDTSRPSGLSEANRELIAHITGRVAP